MSVVDEREAEEITRSSSVAHRLSHSASKRVLVAHPGDTIGFLVRVNSPPGHNVSISVRGIPPSIAGILVSPPRSIAPYTARVSLTVSPDAEPGLYPFYVKIHDNTRDQPVGAEELGLLILPRGLTAHHYSRLKRIYHHERLGAQAVLWYLIAKVYRNGASFTELKKAYELIRGGPVRKATIAVILRRMIRKGLITKGADGRYYPLVTKQEVAFNRIDNKRVRITQPGRAMKTAKRQESPILGKKSIHEPYVAKIAFKRAQKIAQKHGNLAAAYFLVYSLVGVRETGILLMWLNAMFVYCEQKTGFCHYFYSQLLHRYFQLLGLREGIMYKHSQEHLEAMKVASKYVRKYYGNHQSSRRLHYELKRQGYLEYNDEVYNIEIVYYEDGDIGVRIWDNNMEEALYEENITNKPVAMREIKPAYPYEHIHEPNEETYFHRPGGLY